MGLFSQWQLKSLQKKAKNLYEKRERGQVDVSKEINAQLELARFYDKHWYDKKYPRAKQLAAECYRAAALLGSAEAQYLFAKRQLDEGKFWEQWSKGMYAAEAHKLYTKNYFEEAHYYLDKAIEQSYPEAKRLKGVAYIQGYGVPANKEKGFKLIIESITDENAWDKVTEIMDRLGLNNPEFFNYIMSHRH